MSSTNETIFTNANVVMRDAVMTGTVVIRDGRIAEVADGLSAIACAVDLDGDYLIPGLIELHTDHLEQHIRPRPRVRWPELSALMAFDAQIAASGITTVFDCIRAGRDADYTPEMGEIEATIKTIRTARAEDLLRVDHHLHIRCEICSDGVVRDLEDVLSSGPVGLISLMDHTPGARQFPDVETWKIFYGGKSGRSAAELEALIDSKLRQFDENYKAHRQALVDIARREGIAMASHDDATADHVQESIADQVAIAEFPTTAEAAKLSHEAGIGVLMGAPNVVRGGSHSGNVAAEDLARVGVLDVLSSDYVPTSLLFGAFDLVRRVESIELPEALATVTANPAHAAGFDDRGTIEVGKRADVIRVRQHEDGLPIVRETYREGRRVN